MTLQRVEQGTKNYPSHDFNQIVSAAETVLGGGYGGNAASPGGTARNPSLIRVKNVSDVDVPTFGVLRVTERLHAKADDPAVAAKNGGVEFKGDKPNGDDDQIVCITQEAIPKNGIGLAVIWAATGVKVDLKDAAHQYAKPTDGETKKLQSTDSGPWRIVEKPSGTGEQFCYVCPAGGGGGEPLESFARYGTTQQAFAAGTIGNITIYNSYNGDTATVKALLPPNYAQVAVAANTPCIVMPTKYTNGDDTADWLIVSILYSSDTVTP